MNKRTKKVRAEVAWAPYASPLHMELVSYNVTGDYTRVVVLPATAEAYDAMVEQMAKAGIWPTPKLWPHLEEPQREHERVRIREQLRAIGITRPKEARQ